ncbi:MAG: hypothetical protein ABIG08_00970 [bacterium]
MAEPISVRATMSMDFSSKEEAGRVLRIFTERFASELVKGSVDIELVERSTSSGGKIPCLVINCPGQMAGWVADFFVNLMVRNNT